VKRRSNDDKMAFDDYPRSDRQSVRRINHTQQDRQQYRRERLFIHLTLRIRDRGEDKGEFPPRTHREAHDEELLGVEWLGEEALNHLPDPGKAVHDTTNDHGGGPELENGDREPDGGGKEDT